MMPMENYLIQRIVGRGAFGTAFLCKSQNERTMNKDVIIKQIPIEQMSTLDRQVLYSIIHFSFSFEVILHFSTLSKKYLRKMSHLNF